MHEKATATQTETPIVFYHPRPGMLQVEPVGIGDAACDGCPRRPSQATAQSAPAFMHFNVFRALADSMPAQTHLHLQGAGEPLLHLHLFDMVRHAAARGMRVELHSDLSVLTEARADECMSSGLHTLHVALDGATAQTYEAIRGRDRFDRVLRNLRRLMQARARTGSPTQVRLTAPATRANMHELPDLVRLAHDEGVGALTVRHLCHASCGLPDIGSHEHGLHQNDLPRVQRYFDDALALASALDVALVLPAIRRRRQQQPTVHARRHCDPPRRGSVIGHDGRPRPACAVAQAGTIAHAADAEPARRGPLAG